RMNISSLEYRRDQVGAGALVRAGRTRPAPLSSHTRFAIIGVPPGEAYFANVHNPKTTAYRSRRAALCPLGCLCAARTHPGPRNRAHLSLRPSRGRLDHFERLRHAGRRPTLFNRSRHLGALLPASWLVGTPCGGGSVCRYLVRRPEPDSIRIAVGGWPRRLPVAPRQPSARPPGSAESPQT